MTFVDPRWLWLLVALPLLLLLEWAAGRRADRALERLVGTRRDSVLLGQRLPGQRRFGVLLRAGAFVLLASGAAGPEWGHELQRRQASGSDLVLLIDVSASMDVRDVPPSRLDEAKREALAVLDQVAGSKVGVVVFAGDAVRLCPLTLDRSAVRLVIESLSSTAVSEPGSDLGRGLRAAARLLPARRRNEQAIILWTDGEDVEAGAEPAMNDLARAGLRVFAVGVGTPAGDVVPVLDDQGRAVDVKREESGGPHRSRLDERLLRELANKTRGAYFAAVRPGGELPRLLTAVRSLGHGNRGERLVERSVPRFPWFAVGAIVLLGLELARRRRRDDAGRRRGSSREAPQPASGAKGAGAAAAALLALTLAPTPAQSQTAWAKADQAFKAERWAEAESLYLRRAGKKAPPGVQLNLAVTRAWLGKAAEADAGLEGLRQQPGRVGQTAAYDLGTSLAERGRWDDALKELRAAVERDPTDDDARWNYEWALRQKRQPRPENPQPQPQQPQPSPQQPQPSQPQPSSGQGQPQPTPQATTPPTQRGREGMDRQQAERLLGSLEELERLEQQRMRQVRVMREKRGKDW